jgi:hypothetical protein
VAQQDLEITQGSTFEWVFKALDINRLPLDMSGYVSPAGVTGMIRKKYTDAVATESFNIAVKTGPELAAMVTAKTLHLTTTEVASLEPVGSGSCYVVVTLTAIETAAIVKGTYVYDIEIKDTLGFVFKPYSGNVIVSPEATKTA